jgi:hypothetical protein
LVILRFGMKEKTRIVGLKVKRAREHIADLDRRIHLFFTGPPNPYPLIREIETHTGDLVIKLDRCEPVPEDLPLVIGDALQNLRTALDHLVWQLVLSNGGTPGTQTAFPITKNAQQYKSVAPGKTKGVTPEAAKMIDAFRPYGGGNEVLFGLHLLNNSDKHRLLLICGAAHLSTAFQFQLSPTPQCLAMPVPYHQTYPLKEGRELYRIPKDVDGTFDQNPEFTFRLAFGDGEAMGGEPMLPPLHQLADLIDAIILAFDRFMK